MRYLMAMAGMMMLAACAAGNTTGKNNTPAVAAQSATCTPIAAPEITVNVQSPALPDDRSQGYQALTDLNPEKRAELKARRYYALSYVEVKIESSGKILGLSQPMANGDFCVSLKTAEISINWNNHVRLAAELTPDSCADRLMRKHVADMIAEETPRQAGMKSKITQVIKDSGRDAISDKTTDQALQRLDDKINAAVNDELTRETADYTAKLNDVDKMNMRDELASQCHDNPSRKLLQRLDAAAAAS